VTIVDELPAKSTCCESGLRDASASPLALPMLMRVSWPRMCLRGAATAGNCHAGANRRGLRDECRGGTAIRNGREGFYVGA
jgi:hypothetical protein